MIKLIKDYFHKKLVRSNSKVFQSYMEYKAQNTKKNLVKDFFVLMKIKHKVTKESVDNGSNYVNRNVTENRTENKLKNTSKNKSNMPYVNGAESRRLSYVPPQDRVRELMSYDVISFDVFDTLIFRPFAKPRDVFWLIGDKLEVMGFRTLRSAAEDELRDKKYNQLSNREVTIYEIYDEIARRTGINAELGIETEFNAEKAICYANPYMKYVFDTLAGLGKRIVITTDMYLPKKMIMELLSACGYEGYEEVFVSCEYGCSKRDGKLYEVVKSYVDNDDLKIVHVGDKQDVDVNNALQNGLNAVLINNVNMAGAGYRADNMSQIIGSAYRGLVNAHIYNGYTRYDVYYEYGYVYGGLFVLGYCKYIHDYAVNNNIDVLLFAARDGYIIKKVFDELYGDIKTEYIFCSRISNLKIGAFRFKQDYIKQYVKRWRKENIAVTVLEVFQNMDLQNLIPKVSEVIDIQSQLDEKTEAIIEEFINDNWNDVISEYEDCIKMAGKYYGRYLKGSKKACLVDIGWRGQAALVLRVLEKEKWHFGCDITGVVAASAPTAENISQLASGVINAYMFSPVSNMEDYNFHKKNSIQNILTELLLSAPHPSFKGFGYHGQNEYTLLFDVAESANIEFMEKIHQGILDFCMEYKEIFKEFPYMMNISGHDAYMPLHHIFKDYSYFKKYFKRYEFQDCVGGTHNLASRTISDVFRKFKI